MRRPYIFAAFSLAIVALLFAFAVRAEAATVCNIFSGCTGTSTTPAYGQLLIGGKNGEYELVASSTLGSGGGSSSGFSTTSAAYWLTQQTTSNLSEGSNLYFTNARAISALTGQSNSLFSNGAGYLTSLAGAASSTILSDNNTFSGINTFTNGSSNFGGTWQTFSPSHFQTALGFTPYNATNPSNYISLTALSAGYPLSYNSGTGAFSIVATSSEGCTVSCFASSNISQWTNNAGYVTSSFSTTSAAYWQSVNNFFSTTSASYFLSLNQGPAFSTTSASYFLAQNTGNAFSTTSANYWGGTKGYLTSLAGAASSTLLGDNNTFSGNDTFNNTVTGSVSGNAGTATILQNARTINNVSFNGSANIVVNAASSTALGDNNSWTGIDNFSNASSNFGGTWQTFSSSHFQVAGTYLAALGNYATTTATAISLSTSTVTASGLTYGETIAVSSNGILFTPTVTGSLTGLTTGNFASANISQWTNNSGYLTSLAGAASSTLLGDNNTFAGNTTFTASSTFQKQINAQGASTTLLSAATGWIGTLNLTNPLSVANGGTGATSLTGLITTGDLASANISQFTNNSGYLTSLGGAASSTLLSDNNSFSGRNIFSNATTTLLSAGTLWLTGITGSTQCLHVNSAGLISGTGSDCGSGSGGVTGLSATYPLLTTGSTGSITISTALSSSTLTASSPLTGSFAQVGTGGSLGIQVGNASENGYIASGDWATFNNKISSTSLSAAYPLSYNSSTGAFSTIATSSLGLTTASFASSNISQWTNNAGYLTSLSGAASSTILGDNNTFSGINSFTNASSNFSGTWQTFSPSHFQVAGTYVTSVAGTWPIVSSGGTTPTISWGGLSTTSNFTAGQLVYASGAGSLTSVSTSTLSASSPLTGSFVQIGSGGSLGCQTASGSQAGCLSSSDWTTFNGKQAAGNYLTALTGDGSASGPGSAAFTLATVNSNVGSFGGSNSIPSFAVNAKGLITAASANTPSIPTSELTGTISNAQLAHSTIVLNSTTLTLGDSGDTITAASSTLLANNNTWSGLNQFSNATSTLFTSTTAWIVTLNLTNPLAVTQGGTGLTSTSQNFFFAGPTSGSGAPTWRAIVAADIPTLNQNTSGTAAGLSATLAIGSGGTGQTTQQAALNALAPSPTRAGDVIYYNGSNWVNLAGNNSGSNYLSENSSGVPSWASPSGSGTVTSVGASTPNGTLTLGGTNPVTGSGTISFDINLTHPNWWTGLQNFTNASTSEFTATSTAWFQGATFFGSSQQSNFSSSGALTLGTPLATGSGGTGSANLGTGVVEASAGSLTAANPTRAFVIGVASTTPLTGTTTSPQFSIPFGMTVTSWSCTIAPIGATAEVEWQYANPTAYTNVTPTFLAASTTPGNVAISSNNTPTAQATSTLSVGNPSGSPLSGFCTFVGNSSTI